MTKTAFITGGTSGIGKAIIEILKNDGWQIIGPTHQELDLSNLSEIEKYTKEIIPKLKYLDAFIHTAGIWHNNHEVLADKTFASYNSSQIIESMNVGVISAMMLVNAFAPIMKNSTIIGISGTFNSGAKGWVPYYTSKRALEDFLVGLSQDNIDLRVFGISPADTATEAYGKFYPEYFNEAQSPNEIAKLVQNLLNNKNNNNNINFHSGDVIEIREGNTRVAFHS